MLPLSDYIYLLLNHYKKVGYTRWRHPLIRDHYKGSLVQCTLFLLAYFNCCIAITYELKEQMFQGVGLINTHIYLSCNDKDIQSFITLVLDYIIENVWNSLIVCYVTYTVWRYVFLHPALFSNCFGSLNQFKPEFKIWMSHCAPSSSVSKVPSAAEQWLITLATGQTSYARWHLGNTHSRCVTV